MQRYRLRTVRRADGALQQGDKNNAQNVAKECESSPLQQAKRVVTLKRDA
jgi:hypothetical protein